MRAARRRRRVGEQPQVPAAGEVRVEARPLDEAGDAVERARAVDERIAAEELRVARRRADQPEQHPQRRRLARAVRAEVAEDVAALDGQVDVVDRDDLAVALDEPARFDRRRVAHLSARAAASAAAVGIDPASTYETPPLIPAEHRAELRRELVRGHAVERDRRERVEHPGLARLRGVRLPLDDDDRAEPLPVDDEHRPRVGGADEPHVLARQPDERVGRDDRERRGGLHGGEPGDRRGRAAARRCRCPSATRDRRSSRRRAARPRCRSRERRRTRCRSPRSASTGDDAPCA